MSGRRKVLCIELAPSVGGSCFGLRRLLLRLDRALFEPIVVLPAGHAASGMFRTAGVEIVAFGGEPGPRRTQRPRDIGAALRSVHPALAGSYLALRDLWVLLRRDFPVAGRLAGLMRARGVDLVHHNDGPVFNRASVVAALWAKIPQICHVRAFEAISLIDRLLARKVACLVYASEALERHYRARRVRAASTRVVYDGVDCESFAWDGDPQDTRAALGLSEHDRVVANVGRVTWWKGQDDFLLAVAEMVKRQPRTKALIVGGVESARRDQEYASRLRSMTVDLGLVDHVVFTGFRSDIPAILAASDLVVHCPSQPEPFGLVVLEAMAAGRPVVAVDAGGIPEMIEHGVSGLLTPPGDIGAIAGSALALLADRSRAEVLGKQAQNSVRERFSMKRHVAAMQDVYAACLSSRWAG